MKHNLVEEKIEEFKKKFVRESVFGVSIGAIDSFAGSCEKQVNQYLESAFTELYQAGQKDMLERCIGEVKRLRVYGKMTKDHPDPHGTLMLRRNQVIKYLSALSQGDK